MTGGNPEWTFARDELAAALAGLGFPEELGDRIARHLGSPKAIRRMTAYLAAAKPASAELIVDEMLAIKAEIDAWHEKKDYEQANAYYNYVLCCGLGGEEEPEAGPSADEPAADPSA